MTTAKRLQGEASIPAAKSLRRAQAEFRLQPRNGQTKTTTERLHREASIAAAEGPGKKQAELRRL